MHDLPVVFITGWFLYMNISLCENVMKSWHVYFIYIVICIFPTNCKKNFWKNQSQLCGSWFPGQG